MCAAAAKRVLIDTNVWLDRFIPDRPRRELAEALFKACWANDVDMLFPMRALQDVYYQVSVDNKRWVRQEKGILSEGYAHAANDIAWDCIDLMMKLGTPVGADVVDVWYAQHLRHIHPDFEDDMVLVAADRAKVDYLVTNDRQLIQKSTIAALTPEDMIALLEARANV